VAVADTGVGISEEARKRLFTSFMQADVSNTRRFGGTGLGLAITQELVELMNGQIEMIPNGKMGSIFQFTIPLELQNEELVPLPVIEKIEDLRALVVDDRDEPRAILSSYLKDLGCLHVDSAASGQEALEMMRSAASQKIPYTLCFLDEAMPCMDGWRLAAEIRNNQYIEDQYINKTNLVLLVPYGHANIHGGSHADTKKLPSKWFKARISKPVKRKELVETIRVVLQEHPESTEYASVEIHRKPEALPAGISGENTKPVVLIAEDNQINQKLFGMIADKLGLSSILADDGLDALEKAHTHNPDLVLMDIQMPRMNGYEAAEKLRERGFKKPIIAITAGLFADEGEQCHKSGMNDILLKPFRKPELEKVVQKWLLSRKDADRLSVVGQAAPMERPLSGLNAESSQAKRPDNEIFCVRELRESFMDNDELACSVLARFIERTIEQIALFLSLQEAKDWETGRREAHTLRGSSITLGGKELSEAATKMELAFKNQEPVEIASAFDPLKEAFIQFRAFAEDFIRSMQSTGT
jgi:CheY-like chemotaxis protein/HPt (histidine-containing phosphotransfer) domain-containing protein